MLTFSKEPPATKQIRKNMLRLSDSANSALSSLSPQPVLLTIALVALAILWTLGPPALVTRERVGAGGRIFSQLNLRTRLKGEHAPTSLLGRFLEESCLAELPQL
jgi:lipopolysaccharide/colanic/teichoic acid biosynthesis glycosyltransferase